MICSSRLGFITGFSRRFLVVALAMKSLVFFSLFLNLPVGVAMMATFRRYHLDHHSSQVNSITVECSFL